MNAQVEPPPFDSKRLTLPELQRFRHELKNVKIKEATKALNDLRTQLEELDELILQRMDREGFSSFAGTEFTTSVITRDNYPLIEDRTAFEEYVLRTKKLYLLQSRLLMSAVQEEFLAGTPVPGVKMSSKRSISQRKK